MTASPLSVLLIGCGAIGRWVVERLQRHPALNVAGVLVRPQGVSAARAFLGPAPLVATRFDSLVAEMDKPIEVALECAGHVGLSEHGPAVLSAGIDLGLVSSGALAERALALRLEEAARAGASSLTVLSGALAAMDALASAKLGGLDRVIYTGRKPPPAWAGTPAEDLCDLDSLSAAATVFEGSALEAAQRFPKNANVAATVGLAGLGLERTGTRLIADPAVVANTHEVLAEGAFGRMEVAVSGAPLPSNPKSSALTAMSALRFLVNRSTAMRV